MIAVDTNVLIYACDQSEPYRQTIALDLIAASTEGVLLWQVACEFLSASRKLNRLVEFRDLFPLVLPTAANLTRARELHVVHGVSLWDALILAACVEAGVDVLYSEDVPGLETFKTVRVINPLK
jgi:predicted nucleic acid-binding protein